MGLHVVQQVPCGCVQPECSPGVCPHTLKDNSSESDCSGHQDCGKPTKQLKTHSSVPFPPNSQGQKIQRCKDFFVCFLVFNKDSKQTNKQKSKSKTTTIKKKPGLSSLVTAQNTPCYKRWLGMVAGKYNKHPFKCMAELARKDGCSLGTSTKKPKTRQECRASVAAAGEGPRPAVGHAGWGTGVYSPCGDKKGGKGGPLGARSAELDCQRESKGKP